MREAVSFSELSTWKNCRQKWKYQYEEKIKPRRVDVPLKRGAIIHRLIEAQLRGVYLEEYEKLKTEWLQLWPEEREHYGNDLPDTCAALVQGWVKYWNKYPHKTVAVELPFENLDIDGFVVTGRIDWIFEDSRGLWVAEHKSVAEIPSESHRFWDLQTALYVEVAQRLGYSVTGVCWDYLRTKVPSVPKVNKNGSLSRIKIDTDEATWLSAINAQGLNPADYADEIANARLNKWYERRFMPTLETVRQALLQDARYAYLDMRSDERLIYRNLRRECDWCSFKTVCKADLLNQDGEYVRQHEFEKKEAA